MSKEAQLEDGTILEFPDDTPDEVMDKAVREHLTKPGFFSEATNQPIRMLKGLSELGRSFLPPSMRGQIKSPAEAVGVMAESTIAPFKHFLHDPSSGIFQRTGNLATELIGGDPARARELSDRGDQGGAFAAMFTNPAIFAALPLVSKIRLPGLRTPVTLTGDVAEHSISLIDPRMIRPGFDPQKAASISPFPIHPEADIPTGIATLNLPLRHQALQELNLSPNSFPSRLSKSTESMSNLRLGGKKILDTERRMVEIAERPLNASISAYGNRVVPEVQNSIVSDLKEAAKSYIGKDDALSNAINGVADDIQSIGTTVRSLNEFKAHANKEINNLLGATESKQIAASAQVGYAYKLAADSIRQHLYPAIEKMGGPDLTAYGTREAAAIMERDGVFSTYFNEVSPQQASRQAMSYFEYLTGGSLYKTHFMRRMILVEKTPMGKFNEAFRKGLGDVGDFTPERVGFEPLPPTRLMLPATTGTSAPFQAPTFTLPMDTSIEGILGKDLSKVKVTGPKEGTKAYIGTMEAPPTGPGTHPSVNYPNIVPPQQLPSPPPAGTKVKPGPLTSRRKVNRELGKPVAGTVPESVKTTQTPAQARKNLSYVNKAAEYRQRELGPTSATIPERVIAGPETETISNWQYIAPEEMEALGQPVSNAGVIITTDPARVVKTIADIDRKLKRSNPPSIQNRLMEIRDSLAKQLSDYNAYSTLQPPPSIKPTIDPYQRGTKQKLSTVKAYGTVPPAAGLAEIERDTR